MQVVIVSGERGEGKTSFLRQCVRELRRRNRALFGFYAVRVTTLQGQEGYRIDRVNSDDSLLLCRREKWDAASLKLADFWFDEQVIKTGEKWLKEGLRAPHPVFVLDEAGKFELDGFVWDSAIKRLLQFGKGTLLVAVRNRFVERVIEKYALNRAACRVVDSLLFTVEFVNEIERSENGEAV